MSREPESEETAFAERREYDRSRMIVDVFFDGADMTGVASTKDISAGGLYMNTQTELPEGGLLTVRLPFAEGDVIVNAEVVYSNPGGGVGMAFDAWPLVAATLARRKGFTRRFANHGDTTGGFYERGRGAGVLHFLYVDKPDEPRLWQVHFDLYSPMHSPASLLRHLRR